MNPKLCFIPLTEEHIPSLTAIMTRAFDDDAVRYQDCEHAGPEGYDDGSFLRKWGLESGAYAYALALDQELVGCIILFLSPDRKDEGMLGCLFIDPAHHREGLGKAAWFQTEAMFPQVRIWHTETPARSYRNHCFYINTCGFHVVQVNDPQDISQAQFALEKRL